MKHIALLLSSLTLLTVGGSQAAEQWGWSEIADPQLPAARQESWVPVGVLDGVSASRVDIVPVNFQLGPDGSIPVASQLDAAIEAIRGMVANDPLLATTLKARGFGPQDVVGLNHSPFGTVTVFVESQA